MEPQHLSAAQHSPVCPRGRVGRFRAAYDGLSPRTRRDASSFNDDHAQSLAAEKTSREWAVCFAARAAAAPVWEVAEECGWSG